MRLTGPSWMLHLQRKLRAASSQGADSLVLCASIDVSMLLDAGGVLVIVTSFSAPRLQLHCRKPSTSRWRSCPPLQQPHNEYRIATGWLAGWAGSSPVSSRPSMAR